MRNSPHARLRPRQASAIGAATLVFIGMSGAAVPAASAAGASIYNIRIVSSGLGIQIHDPNLVLQPDVTFGPYVATAVLDNLGQSAAAAGAPYLGDYVGPLVGHFNGLGAGQIPPFPPVPGEVRSSYPGQPSAAQENGGYSIQAKSTETESAATVGLGVATPGSENATLFSISRALVDKKGSLSAVGSSGVDLLNIGGVLDIGRVSSIVTMSQAGSGEPKFLTHTDVGTITVSGQKFGLTENGLTAAGSNSGASAGQVNDALKALKDSGLSIRYIPSTVTYTPGTQTIESVSSGAVEVAYQRDIPSQGLVTATYTLGYAQIAATAQSFGTVAAAQAANSGSPAGEANSAGPDASPGASDLAAPAAVTPAGAPAVSATSLDTMRLISLKQRRAQADGPSVALITPSLRALRFGSTLGLPDGCNIFFGSLGAGAAQLGAGDSAGSGLNSGVENCTMLGLAGGDQLTAAMAAAEPLAVINPAINPGIDSFADALQSLGQDQAAYVAPFGPTLVGMADSARFFKGCETC